MVYFDWLRTGLAHHERKWMEFPLRLCCQPQEQNRDYLRAE